MPQPDHPPCDGETQEVCYKLYTDLQTIGGGTWEDAKAQCQRLGGCLAKAENQEQHQVLVQLFQGLPTDHCVRVGADIRNGEWEWCDGSTTFYEPVNENSGNSRELEPCSCFYTGNNHIYDAPCNEDWGQGGEYVCSWPQ